jgi:hypothetical protein
MSNPESSNQLARACPVSQLESRSVSRLWPGLAPLGELFPPPTPIDDL